MSSNSTLTLPRIASQVDFTKWIAKLLAERSEDSHIYLDHLTEINDCWVQSIEQKAANADLIDAVFDAQNDLKVF